MMIKSTVALSLALLAGLTFTSTASAQYFFGGNSVSREELRHIKDHCDSLVPLGRPSATSTDNEFSDDSSGSSGVSLQDCRDGGLVSR